MRVHAQRLCVMNVHDTAMAVLSVDMKIVIMALSWHCHETAVRRPWDCHETTTALSLRVHGT